MPSFGRHLTCARPDLFGASPRFRIIAGGLVRPEEYIQAMR